MSELLVTQCPYCQTRFRLSQQQLAAAAGSVRCGACLKVFNASPTAQPSAAVAPARPAETPEQPLTPVDEPPAMVPRQGTLLIHDDLDFDELDLEALGLDESLIDEVNPRGGTPATEVDELRADAALPPAMPLDPASVPVRDMDAEFELRLDPRVDASSLPESTRASDPLLDLHEDFIASPIQDFGPPPPPEPDDVADEADREPRFGLPRTGSPLRPLATDALGSAPPQGIYLRDRPEYVTPKLSWHEPSDETPEPAEAPAAEPSPRLTVTRLFGAEPEVELEPEPDLGELDIPELREEPVLFEEPPQRPARRRQAWVWGSLSTLAGIMLLLQFVMYNFTALAHDQRTRPVLASVCLLAGCELPPRVDISLLRSSNLMVRSHPEFPNALAVDVILYNRADFTQPFPVLRMSFTDSHGREVASRRFRPEEYLSGELAGARLMPLQTPIHVGLSMLDPGEEAVSYSLDFLSP